MYTTACDGKDDGNIARSAKEILQEQLRETIRDVACDLCEDALILHGRAGSYYHKQLAQEAVRTVAGARRVVNKIEVVARIQ